MTKEKFKIDTYYKVILILGMILSVLWIMVVNTRPFSDFQYYYNLAVGISKGLPWGDTYTSVGYPIVLGGIFKLFGASVLKAKIFNLFLTFISYICFLSILNAIDIRENERKLIFALFVFMPNNIMFNSVLGSEIIFTTILLYITSIYFKNKKYKYIYIGILTGLNTMIKPFFIVFFFAIFLVELLKERRFLKPAKNSIVVLVTCMIVISPWIYRNTKLIGQLTYVSNNGGIVLYINNNSQNQRGRWMPAENVKDSVVNTMQYKEANMTKKNKMLSIAAKKWIITHPGKFTVLGFKRLYNTYFWGDDILYSIHGSNISDYSKSIIFKITTYIRSLVFGAAIIYILSYSIFILKSIITGESDKLDKFNLFIVVLFFMFTCVYFVTEGQGRYAFPEIFIMIYGFYGLIKFIIYKYKEFVL